MSAQYDSYSMQYTTLCRCLSIKHLVNVQIKVVPLSQKQRPIYSRDVLRLINLSTRLKCARHSISSIFFQVLYSRKWFVSCPQVVCSSSPFKPIVRLMSFFWELGRSLIIRLFRGVKFTYYGHFLLVSKILTVSLLLPRFRLRHLYTLVCLLHMPNKRGFVDLTIRVLFFKGLYFYTLTMTDCFKSNPILLFINSFFWAIQ